MAKQSQRVNIVNQSKLAQIIGVHRTTIINWDSDENPLPKVENDEGGKDVLYDTRQVIKWLEERAVKRVEKKLVSQPAQTGEDEFGDFISIEEAKRRKAIIDAQLLQIQLDEKIGKVVLRDDVEDIVRIQFSNLRSALTSKIGEASVKLVRQEDPTVIRDFLIEAVNDALDVLDADEKLGKHLEKRGH